MPHFTYHPAPLSPPATVMVDEVVISDGAVSVRYADIDAVRHVIRSFRGVRSDYLDLIGGDSLPLRLACTYPAGRAGPEDSSSVYLALIAGIAQRLVANRPDLTITLDDAPPWRWAWFFLGLVTLMLGLGVAGFAIYDGVAMARLATVLPVMGTLACFGALIAWSNRPWRPARTIPVDVWRALVEFAAGRNS